MSRPPHIRRRLLVSGIVQGVGFRPFVHRLAHARGLAGFVRNTGEGVEIELEGPPEDVGWLVQALSATPPPLARIDALTSADALPDGGTGFHIRDSGHTAGRSWLPADVGVCEACRDELRNPANRRFRHPFINCTDCGPRYTLIGGLPYDRAATTMAAFTMCARCRAEYQAPGGRRFHAEPIACPDCGPRLWCEPTSAPGATQMRGSPAGRLEGAAALARAIDVLAGGGIVAVKGVGGYHLMCDATSRVAVDSLRRRKQRPHKPFAIVTADLTRAARVATVSAVAAADLASAARPIVLMAAHAGSDLAPMVAPGLAEIGVMLPHAPVHELLVADWAAVVDARGTDASAALVMTSGNRSEEPVVIDDDEARVRLADLADALLMHDRRILMRADDSVLADHGATRLTPIRRSRGYSPMSLVLPHAVRPLLAVGGEVKAAFCLAVDGHAVLSPHIGDMENVETLDAFSAAVDHFCRVFRVEPEAYICDAHPGYLSARWAEQAAGRDVLRVQHHHAHAASLMAEHGLGLEDELVTFCFDGTGFGPDGAIWGGEVLAARYDGYRRLAHLAYAPLPGGDSAARHPCRLALAYLDRAEVEWQQAPAPLVACREDEVRLLKEQLRGARGVVDTSSMGRLFDVVAAVAGVCQRSSYEGQAAMELEAAAVESPADAALVRGYHFGWSRDAAGPLVVQWAPVIRAVAADAREGVAAGAISAGFHEAVAQLIADLAADLVADTRDRRVGLTGGVFQNTRLLRLARQRLQARGLAVLTHLAVPPNDGGLSLGQAAIGAARRRHPDRR